MLAVAFVWSALLGQDPAATPAPAEQPPIPKLEFTGKPLAVPFACTEDTLQPLGLTCPEAEPCPVFVELSTVESVGGKYFLAGNLHSSATTFSSLLLVSEDGRVWTEAHERIPQAVLDGSQFADFGTGWIGGLTLTALPRDPFFLLTTDGGKSWRRRPLFDEARVASIETFAFDSARDGTLILDRSRGGDAAARYELYETKTGGDTWMLREVSSKPLRLKKPRPEPPADIRLRADAATKSYRLEKRLGTRWTTLSAFLVRLPDCVILPKEAAPPPEPEPVPEPPKPASPKPALKKNKP
jgi:hypothetical protein